MEIPGHPSPKRACSRAVEKCLDPVFDEILYVIITEQDVIEDRKLRLHVYDKDKMSKDDVLGFCNFSIAQLLSSSKLSDSRVLHEGASQLLNDIDGSPAKNKKGLSCELDSTISFHPKPKASSSSSSSSKYPVSLSSAAASTIKWTRVEDAVKFRAGMLVIQIHEARGLMRDSKSGGGNKLPYSYCKLYVNGVKCVQSRTCPNNQTPVYNETIELFVGDWMSEPLLSLKVKHVKPAETDETLGEIVFDMESIFSREMHMSATRWFPVVNDGLENGKIRLSFHFRSLMTTHVPRDVMFTSHDDYNFDGLNLNSFIFTLAPTTKMMLKGE